MPTEAYLFLAQHTLIMAGLMVMLARRKINVEHPYRRHLTAVPFLLTIALLALWKNGAEYGEPRTVSHLVIAAGVHLFIIYVFFLNERPVVHAKKEEEDDLPLQVQKTLRYLESLVSPEFEEFLDEARSLVCLVEIHEDRIRRSEALIEQLEHLYRAERTSTTGPTKAQRKELWKELCVQRARVRALRQDIKCWWAQLQHLLILLVHVTNSHQDVSAQKAEIEAQMTRTRNALMRGGSDHAQYQQDARNAFVSLLQPESKDLQDFEERIKQSVVVSSK